MQCTPNAPNVLIARHHIPAPNLPVLHPTVLQQQLRLPNDLSRLHVSHTDGLAVPVDVVRLYDRVFVGAGADTKLAGWVPRGQGWQ